MPLTDTAIRKMKAEAKRYRKTDSDGLIIEVTPNNKKIWRYRYQFAGKSAIYTIGDYPAISLAKARDLRNEAKSLVLHQIAICFLHSLVHRDEFVHLTQSSMQLVSINTNC